MDRQAALARFIGENLAQLTDRGATKAAIKKLRQRFFETHKLRTASRFGNRDVAEDVVKRLVRTRSNLESREHVDQLLAIPYVQDELGLNGIEALVQAAKIGDDSILDPEDLERLTKDSYLASVEEKFRRQAQAKAEAEIESERRELERQRRNIRSEKAELLQAKSELDSIPPDTDLELLVASPKPQNDGPGQPWWVDLGLRADPFPSNRGLDGFPEDQYEDVVVKTDFVKNYLGTIQHSPAEWMGKSIVILGEFGAGKTTLFEFIAHQCGRARYLPILAIITPDASVSKMRYQFLNQVRSQVTRAAGLAATDYRGHNEDDIAAVIEGMASAHRVAGTHGFLVFVDGLHKTRSYQTQCLEFLQQLQSVQERIHSEDLSCGFLIAGGPAWDREFEEDPSLSGSFYRVDRIPPLSEDSAVESVVRRINAQAAVGASPPSIVREPLRNAYRVLAQRLPRQLTFRDYLDHIRERFTKHEYSDLGVTVALHGETVETVVAVVEQSPLRGPHDRLADPAKHSAVFRRALRTILPYIYERRGVDEDEDLFQFNRGAFYVLRKEGFIVPRRRKDTAGLRWYISETLVSVLTKLNDDHGILPSVALEAMFADQAMVFERERETVYGDARGRVKKIINSQRQAWPELTRTLESVDAKLSAIEDDLGDGTTEITDAIASNLQVAMTTMMQAVAIAAGENLEQSGALDEFVELWCAPENAEEMVERLGKGASTSHRVSELYGHLHLHAQQVVDLAILVSDLARGEAICRLNNRDIAAEDKRALHHARVLFLAGHHSRTIDTACAVLETRIRDVVYPALRKAFGPKTESIVLDPKRLNRIKELRSHRRLDREPDPNFLYHVSRSEYPKIIFQQRSRTVLIAPYVSRDEGKAFMEFLELAFSLDDRAAHRDRESFFRKHATEVGDVLKGAPRFLELLGRIAIAVVDSGSTTIQRDGDRLQATLEVPGGLKTTVKLSAPEVEAGVRALLDHLNVYGGLVHVPPLENLLKGVHAHPEAATALIAGCCQKGLVQVAKAKDGFGLYLELTSDGRARLDTLEKANSP